MSFDFMNAFLQNLQHVGQYELRDALVKHSDKVTVEKVQSADLTHESASQSAQGEAIKKSLSTIPRLPPYIHRKKGKVSRTK